MSQFKNLISWHETLSPHTIQASMFFSGVHVSSISSHKHKASSTAAADVHTFVVGSVTRKKSPNVDKSCPKMISLEKS